MASISRTKDMLNAQLGGEWHMRETSGRHVHLGMGDAGEFVIPNPLEHLEYFHARFDTEYALLLSEKLATIGVKVEGISGDVHHIPKGKTDIRITRDGLDTLSQNTTREDGKHHPIRWHIETALKLPHGDRGVA